MYSYIGYLIVWLKNLVILVFFEVFRQITIIKYYMPPGSAGGG